MAKSETLLSLDVGEKRIGVAVADSAIKIAVALETIEVDGREVQMITEEFDRQNADKIIIGFPRNQAGLQTAQTAFVQAFASKLGDITDKIEYQDESLTSVQAEETLKSYGKPYSKADIDAQAACLILQDYLEANYD